MEDISYQHGVGSTRLVYATIPDHLDTRALTIPNKPANIFRYYTPRHDGGDEIEIGRFVVTFKELADRSMAMASGLLALGLRPGDIVAVLGASCPEWLYLEHACLRIKILLLRLPSNILSKDSFLAALRKFKVKSLFLDRGRIAEQLDLFFPGLLSGETNKELNFLTNIFLLRNYDKEHCLIGNVEQLLKTPVDCAKVMAIQCTIDPDDVAILLPTSGSTGLPKYVQHSHFSCSNGALIIHSDFNMHAEDSVYFNDRPYAWIGSFPVMSVLNGSTVVRLDTMDQSPASTKVMFKVMNEEKVTSTFCLAFVVYDAMCLSKQGELTIPASLKYVAIGGERFAPELLDFARKNFQITMLGYGLTECMIGFTGIVSPDKSLESGSISKMSPKPYFEVKVIGEDGKPVRRGVFGTVCIRSPFAMSGYLGDPEKTRLVKSASGWINTSDIGVMDTNGYLEIIGRDSDVISRGGLKIYPQTIEKLLKGNPKVEKVIVVGVPDPRLFNEVCACVSPSGTDKITEDELREICSKKMITNEMIVPKYFLVFDDIPRGHSGKLDRKATAEMARKLLGL